MIKEADPLPSWNDGTTKTAIIEFIAAVTDKKSKDYVLPEKRIATFDNDGTLWVEYPIHTQVLFAMDRIKVLVAKHPEWKTQERFKAALTSDMKTIASRGTKGNAEIILASHGGMTADTFESEVDKWFETGKNEHLDRLYKECIYQPQLELLTYLRANDFKTFIISGSGIQFMRPMSLKAYGIPPWQVVGSSLVSEFQMKNGKADVVRLSKIDIVDDKECKPVGIYEHIGVRPIFAFGNSDADIAMIQYTMEGKARGMGLFVHHTDAKREYVYDRKSDVGKLDKALDQAAANGWHIVSMKDDWNKIFPDK
jgi:phosphoserine phosphatase